ncbi:hypothetical protein RB195_020102 [Necator americanus]|uniref:Uncharacterized protein n=1 Tax=Necator americanus TaxID=51031 RepID=A0ABR1CH90_NECAM
MLFTLGLFLISCGWVTSQDSLEIDPSNFEDLTAESTTTEPTLFEPLPPLPDMTSVQRIPGPPGKNLIEIQI